LRLVDAPSQIAYTEFSIAVILGRVSLPSSFSDSEQVNGRFEQRAGRVYLLIKSATKEFIQENRNARSQLQT
jgi:hypothetical protein